MAQTEALSQLRSYIAANPDIHLRPSAANRQVHYRLFELCACHELNMLLWAALPADVLARASLTAAKKQRRGKKLEDHGVDCATPDLAHVAQVKWYKSGQSIPFRALSTFFALGAGVLCAQELTLVTSEGVTVSGLTSELPIRHVQITDARIDALIWEAAGMPPATEAAGIPLAVEATERVPDGPLRTDAAEVAIVPPRTIALIVAPDDSVPFQSAAKTRSDHTWEAHYCQIRDFAAEFGRIPTLKDSYKGMPFGAWLTHYHRVGGHYQKLLTVERQVLLMAIPGWTFSPEARAKRHALV